MGNIFAVAGSNRTVAYIEEKIFAILPQIYPTDFVDFFIRNYFRFLDDVFHKWLIQFNIQDFSKIMNELDPDLKFIFKELTKNINFLGINLKIINNKLCFDGYHKPKNSFSCLHYKSCHPPHTKNKIALSLARNVVRIVTDNTNNQLQELKGHLLKRKHPQNIIDYSFTKLFQPSKHENNDKSVITFTSTYNPKDQYSFSKFKSSIKKTTNRELEKVFNDKTILLTTRQPKKLRNLLVRATFETKAIPKSPKLTGFFYVVTVFTIKLDTLSLVHHFHLN